ncbi:MAG: glycosyltransferase family 4 protein [Theionarchaea archaeon]|nr:glycosyltransferase family 4 protein [Theionarchaea archaeon]MBU7001437.1 glycosyltransferase family 4 protein [Theionarchaea archaeon]MBU7021898.1 glycosyltransferase family 4 protein [Theionarchaea archaeon]
MKIAIIQNVTLNDHRSVHSHHVACELSRRGIDVDVIVQKTEEELQYTERPYRLIELPGETYSIKGQVQFILKLYHYLKGTKYTIIHAKNPFSSLLPAVLLRKLGKIDSRIIYDMRGLWIEFGAGTGKFPSLLRHGLEMVERALMRRCEHVVAISPALKEVLCSEGIPGGKVTVIIGAGVDIEKIQSLEPAVFSEELADLKRIGYLGTISVARESNKIVEAFKTIHRDDCVLLMIGPVIEPQVFDVMTRDTEKVMLPGFIPQYKALQYLKSCQVAISYHDVESPAYNVAVPTKILEYMAAGVPIVATDHTMYRNILEDGRTAVLTGQNPCDFARGIEYALENPEKCKRMAENAYRDVERFSIQKVVDQLMEVYKSILK